MKKISIIFSLLVGLFYMPPVSNTVSAEAADDVIKVVYHADYASPRRLSAMITSINNMVTTYKSDLVDYDVRIVFVSHGIRFLTNDKLAKTPFAEDKQLAERKSNIMQRLASLQNVHDVKLELCDITRQAINLDAKKLMPNVKLVRSGVVRIAELQHQGFAYIKIE